MVEMAEAVDGILDMEGGEANALIAWMSLEEANFVGESCNIKNGVKDFGCWQDFLFQEITLFFG